MTVESERDERAQTLEIVEGLEAGARRARRSALFWTVVPLLFAAGWMTWTFVSTYELERAQRTLRTENEEIAQRSRELHEENESLETEIAAKQAQLDTSQRSLDEMLAQLHGAREEAASLLDFLEHTASSPRATPFRMVSESAWARARDAILDERGQRRRALTIALLQGTLSTTGSSRFVCETLAEAGVEIPRGCYGPAPHGDDLQAHFARTDAPRAGDLVAYTARERARECGGLFLTFLYVMPSETPGEVIGLGPVFAGASQRVQLFDTGNPPAAYRSCWGAFDREGFHAVPYE
jgi:hypothetical protein